MLWLIYLSQMFIYVSDKLIWCKKSCYASFFSKELRTCAACIAAYAAIAASNIYFKKYGTDLRIRHAQKVKGRQQIYLISNGVPKNVDPQEIFMQMS